MGLINFNENGLDYAKYTWANRPTQAQQGSIITITDIGASDEFFTWTGSRWAPLNGNVVLGQTNVAASVTGTLTTTQLGLVTVPGDLIGPNGVLEIFHTWEITNSANIKLIVVRMNGSGGTPFFSRSETTQAFHQALTSIRHANSTSSQVGSNASLNGGFGTSTGAYQSSSISTSSNFDIYLSGTLNDITETITLINLRVVYRE